MDKHQNTQEKNNPQKPGQQPSQPSPQKSNPQKPGQQPNQPQKKTNW